MKKMKKQTFIFPKLVLCGILAILIVALNGIHCKPSEQTQDVIQTSRQHSLKDSAELGAFLDGIILGQLNTSQLIGSTISVVKDGELFYTKGYGYTDIEKKKPVDSSRTLFRIAQIIHVYRSNAACRAG